MNEELYSGLKKIFHEPNRMAIVSALLMEGEGMRFGDIKQACGLTDGNLSRHLKSLEGEGVVRIDKSFHNSKPLTTVYMTEEGRQMFMAYLQSLESVLKRANRALKQSEKFSGSIPRRKPRKA